MDKIVPLEKLEGERYGRVICYPKCDAEEWSRRLAEMRHLGVEALRFKGEKNVDNIPVLGKGCVGIVVLAHTETGKVALKIRRTDADRAGMKHEAEMLRIANSVDVGPRLLGFTENLLMMEFVNGVLLSRWIETLEDKEDAKPRVRRALREILGQCWRLDETGLDHGELSWAPKHIIIHDEDDVCILDFETASVTRKVSNVTSVCQYLFMRGKTAELISERTEPRDKDRLVAALRVYKKSRTRGSFQGVLEGCLL
ncbi:MAG: serine/threonine protein kinase [Candidatus Bathyarchaeota archaeon]|nr:serine/threonine protein kinase [Candidatus Bathyarchaeota archaeon]